MSSTTDTSAKDALTTRDAFLLTREWQDIKRADGVSQLTLSLWVISDQGPLHLIFNHQEAVFFVEESFIGKTHQLLHAAFGPPKSAGHSRGIWHSNPIGLWSFNLQNVCAVYFQEQRTLYRARELLRENDVNAYEADINPADRFLMERFVTGSLQILGDIQPRPGYGECLNPKIKSAPYSPLFTVVSLDIETSMVGEALYSIGLIAYRGSDAAPYCQRVFMVGNGEDDNASKNAHPAYLMYCDDEKALLSQFLKFIHEVDPDIIIGWNVVNFDLRFLQRKADQLHIPLRLGRAGKTMDWRQSQDNQEHYTVKIPGRLVLDGIDTLKSATFNFESFSLQFVSNALLKRGKLIHDTDNRGEEISRLFHEEKPVLAAYNLEDCQLVWDIFTHTHLLNFAVERAQLTGLPMDRSGGSVAAFDNRYLPRLHRAGYVAPNLPEESRAIGSPGGYVMDSFPGIYDHVLVFDFKSLYPSIIRTFKIDPMGLIEGGKLAKTPASKAGNRNLKESTVDDLQTLVPGYNGAVFSKTRNILPDIIRELWDARDEAKRQQNAAMSQAIKILMNSFYGVLGTPGCRFFDSRLPSSITLRGHDILTRSKAFIEKKGFQVIYGDTDSVFVWLKDLPAQTPSAEIRATGAVLAQDLNAWWAEYLQQTYQLTCYLEIQFETHFSRFIMPTIRGSDVGSKKRYAGMTFKKIAEDGQPTDAQLIFKGLESVRTDWTPLAREFQQGLYRRVFFNEPYEEFIRCTVADLAQGKCDALLVYRKRIRSSLDDYQRNIPPHVQAAHKAEEYFKRNGLPSRYRRGGWIRYVMTTQGPEPLECTSSPLDYDHYVERQIKPIVDGILNFYKTSFDAIVQHQLGLFDF